MKKILIASVGGSSELIVNTIVQMQADFVYFLCSTGNGGSEESIEKTIVPRARLSKGSYAVELVQSPNDMTAVRTACLRIEEDLKERFASEEQRVFANYTGGTRTMSAGLVARAERNGWDTEWTAPPERAWCGRVSRVNLEAVTVFSKFEMACSAGINVLIGENGTGKTHLLKCMYALLRAAEESEIQPPVTERGDKLERVLGGSSKSFFAAQDEPSRVIIDCANARFVREELPGVLPHWELPPWVNAKVRSLFLPSREVLSMYRGFTKAYDNRELAFDETYYDLCKELGQVELREPSSAFAGVLDELERIIRGKVRLDLDSFVVDTGPWPIAAPMVAEGHRKLASLAYLIKSGALREESVLFWDEPDANLHPLLIKDVARVLRTVAKAGVQIFVATHDDLLAGELSLAAEHGIEPAVDTVFFSLYRSSENGAVEVETRHRWGDLQHNPIVDAYAAHYDLEQELFTHGPQEPQS